jgi:hypothetical protein
MQYLEFVYFQRAVNFHRNDAFFHEMKKDKVFHEAFNQTLFSCSQHLAAASENRSDTVLLTRLSYTLHP